MLKTIKQRFIYFRFFEKYLKERVYILVVLNLLVGVLDGLGLSMFLPLLQLAGGANASTAAGLDKLGFLVEGLAWLGIPVQLKAVLLLITVFFVLKGVAYYLKGAYQVAAQQYFIKSVRLKSVEVLCGLKYQYFTQIDSGRIQNTLTTEIERVAKACQSYFQSFQHLILIGVYVAFAFVLDWQFALMVCAGGLVIERLYGGIYKRTKGVSRKLTDGNSAFQGLIAEFLNSYTYLKSTGAIATYQGKLNSQIAVIESNNKRIGILAAFLGASREPLTIAVLSVVILLQVSLLDAPFAAILLSLLFFYRALSSLIQYQLAWNAFLSVSGSLENTGGLIRDFELNRELPAAAALQGSVGRIELEDVYFGYSDIAVLKGLTLSIKAHDFIALVGPSGSGKSTLASLITGLLKPCSGHVRIGGCDLAELDLNSYQRRIGYIPQEPVVFNDSVYNNVTLWADRTVANLGKFKEACVAASIWPFVEEHGDRWHLGANGLNLSGGQKQRIAMARELYKEVELLVMDEATSAMDSYTEWEIQESIGMLKGKVTIICIAHRLSTVKHADQIIYLDEGKIVEQGSFAELRAAKRGFGEMVALQTIG